MAGSESISYTEIAHQRFNGRLSCNHQPSGTSDGKSYLQTQVDTERDPGDPNSRGIEGRHPRL